MNDEKRTERVREEWRRKGSVRVGKETSRGGEEKG
jgi:hypothetical protein